MFYRYYDPTYVLVILGALICLAASFGVKSTFAKYSRVRSMRGVRAEEVARAILNQAGAYDVRIERIRGDMTDHYSPREKVLRLSDTVYGSTSVAAIGVAAHECGHAIQHQENYVPNKIRGAIVPVVNLGSQLSWPMILLGLLLQVTNLIYFGIILFSLVVLFQLVTLPVEFNASARAIRIIDEQQILYEDEIGGAKKVLTAAALTYVASLISSVLQLLRLVLLFRDRED